MQSTTPRFDARDYFRIIQKRKWFIVLVALAAMLIGGLYAVSYPRTYRATSLILVRQRPSGVVWLTDPNNAAAAGGDNIALETQCSMIMSSELAQKVAIALRETRGSDRVVTDAAEVQESITATPMPPDRIRIDASSPLERNAIAFANAAAEQFLIMNTDFRQQEDRKAREYLEESLKSTESELKRVQDEATAYQNAMGVYTPDAGASQILEALRTFENSKLTVQTELAATRGQLAMVASLMTEARSSQGSRQRVPNPAVAALQRELVTAQVALADLRTRYRDDHPAVKTMAARVQALQAQIDAAPATVEVPFGALGADSAVLAQQRDALRAREADLTARIAALDAAIVGLKKQAENLPDKMARMEQLKTRITMLQEARSRIVRELESKRLQEQAKGGTALILDSATRATSASPSVSRGLLFAGVLGLVAGIALALLLEALDDTIHTPEDITRDTDINFLGMVPLLETGTEDLITILSPKSPPAEAYRTLRSNINFSMLDQPARRFLVTSAGAGEGKSVTAANIAVVFAQAGQSVILVDTDLRRPSLHRLLHCESTRGLTNVLVGESSIEEVLQDTHVEGLRLIASGPLPPNPAEMLDSAAMERFIAELTNYADVILFDSPPAIVLTDAVILASKIERTILVAESGQVTREAFNEAVRLINNARGNILGVVLNKLRLSASDYYYYYYYYDYSRETPRISTPPADDSN